MPSALLSEQQQDLVERIGVAHDRLGLPPAAGRVLGLLLVSSQPELTFDQIREELGLSKSSTSTALNLLLRVGSVEYSTRPGDRKRYFRKRYDAWEDRVLERFDIFFSLGDLIAEAAELQQGDSDTSSQAKVRMADYLSYLKREIHGAHENWKQRGADRLENS